MNPEQYIQAILFSESLQFLNFSVLRVYIFRNIVCRSYNQDKTNLLAKDICILFFYLIFNTCFFCFYNN